MWPLRLPPGGSEVYIRKLNQLSGGKLPGPGETRYGRVVDAWQKRQHRQKPAGRPITRATDSAPVLLPSPQPQYPELELKNISGSKKRLALINDQTMAAGEQTKVRLGKARVTVECVEIRGHSVMVRVGDDRQLRELQLRPSNVISPVGLPISSPSDSLSELVFPSALERMRRGSCVSIISGRLLAVGEKADMTVNGERVTVECLAIRNNSAVVRIGDELREVPLTSTNTPAP